MVMHCFSNDSAVEKAEKVKIGYARHNHSYTSYLQSLCSAFLSRPGSCVGELVTGSASHHYNTLGALEVMGKWYFQGAFERIDLSSVQEMMRSVCSAAELIST